MSINSQISRSTNTLKDVPFETTIDGFHRDSFQVYQPASSGHRSGLDALLLAASLPSSASGVVADLGAGAGVAGFAALNVNPLLELVAVERNPEMIDLLNMSLELPANRFLKTRATTLLADVSKTGINRVRDGLEDNSFDHVMMNPPYYGTNCRITEDTLKAEAHLMGAGGIDSWFRTAAAIVKPGGLLCLIYPAETLPSILACSQGRFGGLEIRPIHSHANSAAKRLLICATRASRAPLMILPGLIVHKEDGSFRPETEAIFEGKGSLDMLLP